MKIGVIGCGYIGLNTSLFFAKKGIEVIGIDIDRTKVEAINRGEIIIKELKDWLPFDSKPLFNNYIKAYTDSINLLNRGDIDVIFIAVPTEKNGKPYFKCLEPVINDIMMSPCRKSLVIIESTLMPGVSDKYIKPYIKNFVVAPRRDWFDMEGRNIENIPRIVGGNTKENTKKAIDILKLVCKKLIPCTYKEAELVKATENSIRHIGAVYAQELTLAHPDIDIRKVLKLASTKWNVPFYYPNVLGSGGYCIPLSSRYVKQSAKNPKDLTILDSVINRDDNVSEIIANYVKQSNTNFPLALLGISYLGNLKVAILSGSLRFLKHFNKLDNIYVNDPLYSNNELKDYTGFSKIELNELNKTKVIIIGVNHDFYKQNVKKIIAQTQNAKVILDIFGVLEQYQESFKCPYIVPGRTNWRIDLKILLK